MVPWGSKLKLFSSSPGDPKRVEEGELRGLAERRLNMEAKVQYTVLVRVHLKFLHALNILEQIDRSVHSRNSNGQYTQRSSPPIIISSIMSGLWDQRPWTCILSPVAGQSA